MEQEVMSKQRHTRQEPDPMARMTAMLKDLEQKKFAFSKKARHRKSETMFPLWVTKIELNQKEGQQWEGEPTPST